MSASAKRILQFLAVYLDSYEKQLALLSPALREMVLGRAPGLLSTHVVAYALDDGVVIYDESVRQVRSSMPYPVLERHSSKVNGRDLEVRKVKASVGDSIAFLTAGLFRVSTDKSGENRRFGAGNHLIGGTINTRKEVIHLGEIYVLPYLDDSGWDPGWAWLLAEAQLLEDIRGAEFNLLFHAGLATKEERERLGRGAALLGIARYKEAMSELETLLDTCASDESKFQDFFEKHPYILSLRGKVTPKPFLDSRVAVSNIGSGRQPDFLITVANGLCQLVEIECADKDVLTKSKDFQQTRYVTQAMNQVRKWDQIIRLNPHLADTYPGIEYHKDRIIIGRSYHPCFSSYAPFQSELANVNAQHPDVKIDTYDVILEEAKKVLTFLELIAEGLPSA